MKKFFFFVLLYICSVGVNAADRKQVSGKISEIQLLGGEYDTYATSGNAIMIIYMDALPVACNNGANYKRVAISSDHPAFNVVASAALAAKAADQTVTLHYLEQCTVFNNNAWDFSILLVQ